MWCTLLFSGSPLCCEWLPDNWDRDKIAAPDVISHSLGRRNVDIWCVAEVYWAALTPNPLELAHHTVWPYSRYPSKCPDWFAFRNAWTNNHGNMNGHMVLYGICRVLNEWCIQCIRADLASCRVRWIVGVSRRLLEIEGLMMLYSWAFDLSRFDKVWCHPIVSMLNIDGLHLYYCTTVARTLASNVLLSDWTTNKHKQYTNDLWVYYAMTRSTYTQKCTLTNSSDAFSWYLFTISGMLQRCSSNNAFANDGAHFIKLHRHSIDSFNNFSTSSTDRQSYKKFSGSIFNALWCTMSKSSVLNQKGEGQCINHTCHTWMCKRINIFTFGKFVLIYRLYVLYFTCIVIFIVFAIIIWWIFHIRAIRHYPISP